MKKGFGIFFLVLVGINFIAIISRAADNRPIGSIGYIIVLFILLIAGLAMVSSKKKEKNIEKDGDEDQGLDYGFSDKQFNQGNEYKEGDLYK